MQNVIKLSAAVRELTTVH